MRSAIGNLDKELHQRMVQKKKKLKLTDKDLDKIEHELEVDYVYNTNAIEGNTLNRGQTALVLRGLTVSNKPLTEIREIANNPSSIEFIKELAFDKNRKITQEDILELHRLSMEGVIETAGSYRTEDTTVAGAGFTPTSWYLIREEMDEVLEFINENPDELYPIELAAHAHYFFDCIHPFDDGNGRLSRLLLNFVLLRSGYPFLIIRKVDKRQYLDALLRADRGDFEPFLRFIARLVEQMLDTQLNAITTTTTTTTTANQDNELQTLTELAKYTPYSAKY